MDVLTSQITLANITANRRTLIGSIQLYSLTMSLTRSLNTPAPFTQVRDNGSIHIDSYNNPYNDPSPSLHCFSSLLLFFFLYPVISPQSLCHTPWTLVQHPCLLLHQRLRHRPPSSRAQTLGRPLSGRPPRSRLCAPLRIWI